MSERILFTSNYSDLSTNRGFQFEFNCERCGNGYRSRFKASTLGGVSEALGAAGSLLGGIFGNAADLSERVRSANWQKARDAALEEAIREITPEFIQCPRCSNWVCRKACWNQQRGLCKHCAPDLGVEMSAAQASHSVEEIWAHARMADDDKHLTADDWRGTIRASCPHCEAPLGSNAKFCPECGAKLGAEHCPGCGGKLAPNAKFCAECGQQVGGG
ncbi:MAG TPA: zinc ribbon domain-containing protein [Armatimonadota bacterium]|nr:zinc ribbon domain-containing protein [Armatimonadota bacterium]HOS43678.1 zinc ribbon domain-containing protein [Armatimonadota bacterium]